MSLKNTDNFNQHLLHEKILITCNKNPNKIALKSSEDQNNYFTFKNLSSITPRLASLLKNMGVKNEEKIGLLAENCPEWGVAYLSILCAGSIVVPFDPALKPAELTNLLNLSKIKYLYISKKQISLFGETIKKSENNIELIQLDNVKELSDNATESYLNQNVKPDDPAVLIYTSGTTGDPKAVVLTHRNLITNLDGIAEVIKFYPTDTFLSLLPLFHTFEATCGFLTPMTQGLTVIYAKSLKSKDIIDDVKKYAVTFIVGVPLLYDKMYNSMKKKISELPLLKRLIISSSYLLCKFSWLFGIKVGNILFNKLREKAGLNTVRIFVSGGAPLPDFVAEWFNLIGFEFLEGYGLTECAPVVAVNRKNKIRFGSVGPPLPNVEIKIKNPSSEGIGEILVRGENNTPGYYDNPEATNDLLKDGWLYTGDLGVIKKDCLYIKGRAKNLIVSAGGKNIYPEELEEIINQSPYILESLVLGRKKPKDNHESIFAIIVPDIEQLSDESLAIPSETDLDKIESIIKVEINKANCLLSNYKRISNFEIQWQEFEKTSTKKIKRVLYK
ncbi:MAG: long-chain fatty acid--CoA ligase [candidate division Zixibacteria bacterium]|nr:long-chain fatty acid--CoA ligase [candidate division Zixibacteria bacterium]